MITILYKPIYSTVTSDNIDELSEAKEVLAKALTFQVPGYFFAPSYDMGLWDGTRSFFSNKNGRFLSGLLSRIHHILFQAGFDVRVFGYPNPQPGYPQSLTSHLLDKDLGTITLYDYQIKAVNKILKYSRGIIRVATNGGKTEVMAAVIKAMGIPPTVVFVHRKELLFQNTERLGMRLGVHIGRVGAGIWEPNSTGVTVVMYHTLYKKKQQSQVKNWMRVVKIAFADECHFLSDARYQGALTSTAASVIVGTSGTPYKDTEIEKHNVIGHCGPVLCTVGNAELINRGISVKPKVIFLQPAVPRDIAMRMEFLDFASAIQECTPRHELIGNLANAFVKTGRQTVIMVERVEHGKMIQRYIPDAVLTHSQSGNRQQVKERLESGEVFCCICTSIFRTGLSVDHIEALIMAAGGKSLVSLLQGVGRALRVSKVKEKDLWVVDFWDIFNKQARSHSRDRWEVYKHEKAFDMTEDVNDLPAEVLQAVLEGAGVGYSKVLKSRKRQNSRQS